MLVCEEVGRYNVLYIIPKAYWMCILIAFCLRVREKEQESAVLAITRVVLPDKTWAGH